MREMEEQSMDSVAIIRRVIYEFRDILGKPTASSIDSGDFVTFNKY